MPRGIYDRSHLHAQRYEGLDPAGTPSRKPRRKKPAKPRGMKTAITSRTPVTIVLSCSACLGDIAYASYSFCPHCGAKFDATT